MSGAPAFMADWTSGTEAIAYQACPACKSAWYFRRQFCPSCGAADPVSKAASGNGTVYAETLVHRAPVPEAKGDVPYKIVLVDTAEGFRMMGHGDPALRIGDAVTARFKPFLGGTVPYFVKAG